MTHARFISSSFAVVALLAGASAAHVACSGGGDDTLPANGDDGGGSSADTGGGGGGGDGATGDAPATTSSVTFAYHPSWSGVTKVSVVGGFGQASDWSKTASFVDLQNDGSGTWKATATLPAGQYAYVFRVTGDVAASLDGGGNAATNASRYAVDPANPSVAPCPMASPTYDAKNPNPCSEATVPQPAAAALHHVTGKVTSDGAGAAGYIVVVEREEPQQHHFFADRATTGADGRFDLEVADGQWRLQVQHPTFLAENDTERSPLAEGALLRTISSSFPVHADVTVDVPDMAYHAYPSFQPQSGTATLPTTFQYTVRSSPARLSVYGGPNRIGDPFFASPFADAGTYDYDGAFNTAQAPPDAAGVALGTKYFWGLEERAAGGAAGPTWTNQTMVFPITWH